MTYPMNDPTVNDWQELRDEHNHLWGWYSPSSNAVRFERKKGKSEMLRATIPLDRYRRR